MVTEYLDEGSLVDILETYDYGLRMTEPQMARVCCEVLKGLDYLHYTLHRIHRDIKSDNIGLKSDGSIKISKLYLLVILLLSSTPLLILHLLLLLLLLFQWTLATLPNYPKRRRRGTLLLELPIGIF